MNLHCIHSIIRDGENNIFPSKAKGTLICLVAVPKSSVQLKSEKRNEYVRSEFHLSVKARSSSQSIAFVSRILLNLLADLINNYYEQRKLFVKVFKFLLSFSSTLFIASRASTTERAAKVQGQIQVCTK